MSPEWTKHGEGKQFPSLCLNQQKHTRMKANYWVIATGKDCDGHNGGRIDAFERREDATNFANDMNDWSDGIRYSVISDIWDMKSYCDDYNKNWEKYLNV